MWQTVRTFSNSDKPMDTYSATIGATVCYVATGYRVFFLTPDQLAAAKPNPAPFVLRSGSRPRLFKSIEAAQYAAERAARKTAASAA